MPKYVVDIGGLGLSGITFSQSDGLRIGATTTIAAIQEDPRVPANFGALFQASAGHPVQIANQATIAGNLAQEVWCWYLRNNYDCWRNGGNVCYGVIGDNRYYQSIFGGRPCHAVHAGDIAPALFALDAEVSVFGPSGSTSMPIGQFMPGTFVAEGQVKGNILRSNEIITEIHIPALSACSRSSFFKVSDRGAIDFALASCAVCCSFTGVTVSGARIVLGAVSGDPIRATAAEEYLVGRQLTEDVVSQAAEKALGDAAPLTHGTGNQFRVYLAQGAVKNALRRLNNT